jgi:EF-P beta-lysylation protein EpmB
MPSNAAIHAADAGAPRWQTLLQNAFRDTEELFAFLELSRSQIAALQAASNEFPLLVPRGFAARMRKRDSDDPLLRQVLSLRAEGEQISGFDRDPLQEIDRARGGLIRKYAGRALLVTTAACPVHCRYCFRRHFPYSEQTASRDDWGRVLADLGTAVDLSEVILSGGDPLSLSNRRLANLIEKLEKIDHVTTLRIHSRFPIVLPERIDSGLLQMLAASRLDTVVVTHCNHAQEIDESVAAALQELRSTGVTLLNQSVLLRGINDALGTLCALSRRLLAAGVLPYYLHELDPVAGAAHFQVSQRRAKTLIRGMRRELPGYLVPRLVREIPGELSKTVIA